jgi:hypothetical protein
MAVWSARKAWHRTGINFPYLCIREAPRRAPFLLPQMFAEKIDKAAQTVADGTVAVIHRIDWHGDRQRLLHQNRHQIAALDVCANHKIGQAGNAVAMQAQVTLGFTTVGGQAWGDFQLPTVGAGQWPAIQTGQIVKTDAAVFALSLPPFVACHIVPNRQGRPARVDSWSSVCVPSGWSLSTHRRGWQYPPYAQSD